jgi:hypothetical protein
MSGDAQIVKSQKKAKWSLYSVYEECQKQDILGATNILILIYIKIESLSRLFTGK